MIIHPLYTSPIIIGTFWYINFNINVTQEVTNMYMYVLHEFIYFVGSPVTKIYNLRINLF